MRRVGFAATTLFISFFVHIIFRRYLSFFDVGPDVLFMVVLASGFLLGSLTGSTIGFCCGLLADCLGIHLFGFQTFLFSLGGYAAGSLRRRVDSERPIPQIVIALVGTLLYGLVAGLMRNIIEETGQRTSVFFIILESILNGLFMPFVFWAMSRWISIWNLNHE